MLLKLKDRLPDAVQCPQDVIDWLHKLANYIDEMLLSDSYFPYQNANELLEDVQALLQLARQHGWFERFPAKLLGDNYPDETVAKKLYYGACKMEADMGRFEQHPDPDQDERQTQWALRVVAEWFQHEKIKLNGGGIIRPKGAPGATMLPDPTDAQGGKGEQEWALTVANLAKRKKEQAEPKPTHSEDFTDVDWYGTKYHFDAGQQSKSVEALWAEFDKGGLGLSEKTIGEKIGSASDNFRLLHVFRAKNSTMHKAWGTMIQKAGVGCYKLVKP